MLFRTINRNKKPVVLALRTDTRRAAVLELIRHCDILLSADRKTSSSTSQSNSSAETLS